MSVHSAATRNAIRLLHKTNVVGVGESDGEVIVYVSQKLPLSALAAGELVDPLLVDDDGNEVPTDVIESGEFWALGGGPQAHTSGLRPGASLGRYGQGGTGTLGCLVVTRDGKLHLLSNHHVIAAGSALGTRITHPGPGDARTRTRKIIGELRGFAPILFTGTNRMDAAIAEVTDMSAVVGNDAVVGMPSRVLPAVGTTVIKTGRTTGTTSGSVVAHNVTVSVNYGGGNVGRFTGQIVTSKMLSPGDSGSVGWLDNGRPWGLGFAGSGNRSIYNPLHEVFDYFGLSMLDAAEPPPSIKEWLTDLHEDVTTLRDQLNAMRAEIDAKIQEL